MTCVVLPRACIPLPRNNIPCHPSVLGISTLPAHLLLLLLLPHCPYRIIDLRIYEALVNVEFCADILDIHRLLHLVGNEGECPGYFIDEVGTPDGVVAGIAYQLVSPVGYEVLFVFLNEGLDFLQSVFPCE